MRGSFYKRFADGRFYNPVIFFWLWGALAVLGAGHIGLIDVINSKWPPQTLDQKAAVAVAVEDVSLSQLTSPNVLAGFELGPFRSLIVDEIEKAAAKATATSKDGNQIVASNISIDFSNQTVAIGGDFSVTIPSRKVKIKGHVEAAAAISHLGTSINIAPALSALWVDEVEGPGAIFWFLNGLPPVVGATLTDFRDNINGQLPVYTYRFPISPLLVPGGQPNTLPVTIIDPFDSTKKTAVQLLPPTLKGMAVLIDHGKLLLLAELSLSPVPMQSPLAPVQKSFAEYRNNFLAAATRASLPIHPDVVLDIAPSLVAGFIAQYVTPTYSRDRVTQAVQASLQALAGLQHVDAGLSIDSPTLLTMANKELNKALANWHKPEGVTINEAHIDIAPQYFIGSANGSIEIPAVGGEAGVNLKITAPIGTTATGISAYPAIDEVDVTNITPTSFGDLAGLIGGINTVLANAVAGFNSFIPPWPFDIPAATFKPFDLKAAAASKPGLTVSPEKLAPPPIQFSHPAFVLGKDRIWVLAQWDGVTGSLPLPPLPQPEPGADPIQHYRIDVLALWQSSFGDPTVARTARALVKEASLAEYVNSSLNGAGIHLSYSGSSGSDTSSDVNLGSIPEPTCNSPIKSCPSCSISTSKFCLGGFNPFCTLKSIADCGARLACEGANAAAKGACEATRVAVIPALNAFFHATLGSKLGYETANYGANYNVDLSNFTFHLAQDLSSVTVGATPNGHAEVEGAFNFQPQSFGGRLICPVGDHVHFPVPSGTYPVDLQNDPIAIAAQVTMTPTTAANAGSAIQADIKLTPVTVSLRGRPVDTQIDLALRTTQIQCPLTNVIDIIPGVGLIQGLLDFGAVTSEAFPNVLDRLFAGINNPITNGLFRGQFSYQYDFPEITPTINLPALSALNMTFKPSVAMSNGLIELDGDLPNDINPEASIASLNGSGDPYGVRRQSEGNRRVP